MVMIHIHEKDQGQRSVGSKDRAGGLAGGWRHLHANMDSNDNINSLKSQRLLLPIVSVFVAVEAALSSTDVAPQLLSSTTKMAIMICS